MNVKFDPEKGFGTVHGICNEFPGARFQQGNYIFDAHRKCLNPNAEGPKGPNVVEDATDDLIKRKAVAADHALALLAKAKERLEAEGTSSAKGSYTKALKVYNKAQEELDKISS